MRAVTKVKRTRFVLAVIIWEFTLLALAVVTYEVGLPWRINQLMWWVFGPWEIYSLPNFYVHRLVAWLLYSIAASMVGLWAYGKLSWADRETRCRRCGYILRGLSEPRCSECGEDI